MPVKVIWIFIIALILGVTLYVMNAKQQESDKEGFQESTPMPGVLKALEESQNEMRDVFHYQLGSQPELTDVNVPTCKGNWKQSREVSRPGEIVVNSRVLGGIPNFEAKLNSAMQSASTWRLDSPATDYSRIMNPIPFGASQENQAVCRRIQHPSNIDRGSEDGVEEGCGWLFVPDGEGDDRTLRESVCLLGSPSGPKNRQGLQPFFDISGTVWIWNKAEAVRREDSKRAARVRDCTIAVRTSGTAFCKNADGVTGYGIPYNSATGYPRYNIPKYGTSSTETDWSKAARCADGEIAYNINMCPQTSLGQGLSACTSKLTSACVDAVLTAKGFKREGLLRTYKAMEQSKRPDISLLLLILREEGNVKLEVKDIVPTESEPSTKTPNEFIAIIDKIVGFTLRQRTSAILRDTALYMREGRITAEIAPFNELYFDFCNYYPETAGRVALHPVALACLQQEFRKVGCQVKGTGYPSSMYDTSYTGKTLNQIRAMFRGFREAMTSAEMISEQTDAVSKCLGIRIGDAPGTSASGRVFCNERGIEYIIFSYDVGGNRTLRYRFKSTVGLLKDPASFVTSRASSETNMLVTYLGNAERNRIPGADKLGYLARTSFTVPADVSGSIESKWFFVADTYTLRLNGEPILPIRLLTRSSDPRTNQYQIILPNLNASVERYQLDIDYKGSAGSTWGNPSFDYMDKNLEIFQLRQNFFDPVIRYDFHKGILMDTNGLTRIRTNAVVLTNRTDSSAVVSQTTRTGLTWRVKPTIAGNIVPVEGMRMRNGSIHMIMMSVFVDSENSTLFRLTHNDRFTEDLVFNQTSIVYQHSAATAPTRRLEFTKTGSGMLGRWTHVAVIYRHVGRRDPDRQLDEQRMSIYVDGESLKSKGRTEDVIFLEGLATPWELSMSIDLLSSEFVGNMGWFRLYDQAPKAHEDSGNGVEGFQNSTDVPTVSEFIQADKRMESVRSALSPNAFVGAPVQRQGYTFDEISNTSVQFPNIHYNMTVREFDTDMINDDGITYKQSNRIKTLSYQGPTYNGSLLACHDACESEESCVAFTYTGENCKLFSNVMGAVKDPVNVGFEPAIGNISVRQPGRLLPNPQDQSVFEILEEQREARNAIKRYYGVRDTDVGPLISDEEPSFVNYLSKAAENVVSMYEAMFPKNRAYLGITRRTDCPIPEPPVSVETALSDYRAALKTVQELSKMEGCDRSLHLTNMIRIRSMYGIANSV